MIKDDPHIKKKNERARFKSNKVHKRAMFSIWSDSDSFGSQIKDEEIVNHCFMGKESSRGNDKSEEVCFEAKISVWNLDSGCVRRMIGDASMFIELLK